MKRKSPPRFPPRKLRPDGSFGCRGCGGDIPQGRKTWCSHKCVKTFDPFYVKKAVQDRCGNKCEKCQKDCSRQAQMKYRFEHPAPQYPWQDRLAQIDYKKAKLKWRREFPLGEFDHIIPHCEGGQFVVENIRMLCTKCHLERTKEWRAERKKNKQQEKLVP